MNEAKFTKGPWRVNEYIHGVNIASSKEGELITDYVYELADAHLIAAAPEMYEYILELKSELEAFDPEWNYPALNELLAKARGEL